MEHVPIPEEEVQDPQGILMPGKNMSRDPQRTPMQWSKEQNAGFTEGKPWIRFGDYQKINVEDQKKDPESILLLYKRLIELRQKEAALKTGDYYPIFSDKKILSYMRKQEGADSFLIIVNLTNEKASFKPEHVTLEGTIIIATSLEKEGQEITNYFELAENEGIVVRLK